MSLLKLMLATAFAAPTFAGPLVWQLQNVSFNDGGTASGSYTYDADTNTVTNWALSVIGGDTANFPAYTYDLSTAHTFVADDTPTAVDIRSNTVFCCGNPGQERLFYILLSSPMTNSGGTIPMEVGFIPNPTRECYNCTPVRIAMTGEVTTVPEPAPIALLLPGLLFVSRRLWRGRFARRAGTFAGAWLA